MDEELLKLIFRRQQTFMPWEEWAEKVKLAYAVLIKRAKGLPYGKMPLTYSQLGSQIGLTPISEWFPLKMGFIAGACSMYEYENKRPFISALVISSDTNRPGKGFWGLPVPVSLRKTSKIEDISAVKLDDSREEYWISQLKEIDKLWKTD